MTMVLMTALGVGLATVFGAILGFIIKNPSHRLNDIILAFAAGVMLAAAVFGLIAESIDLGGKNGLFITVLGIFAGAVCMILVDKLLPHLHNLSGSEPEDHPKKNANMNKILLFVIAIAIHNLPEGLAAGVGFGTGNTGQALSIAGGIALQNIPEGMVIIAPMLGVGIKKRKAFVIALITGLIEVVGTLIGYIGVHFSEAILPFALAFAGGTMLYATSDEIIPETHSHGNERAATFSLLVGFCVMLLFDALVGA